MTAGWQASIWLWQVPKARLVLAAHGFTASGLLYNRAKKQCNLLWASLDTSRNTDFPPFIPLRAATISPLYLYPNFSTFEREVSFVTVLVQNALSDTLLANASPSVHCHSYRIGLYRHRTSALLRPGLFPLLILICQMSQRHNPPHQACGDSDMKV